MQKNNRDISLKEPFIANIKLKNTLWWGLFIALTTLILASGIKNPSLNLYEGEIAADDVYYQGAVITYTSQIRTQEARTNAASQVAQIYRIDYQAAGEATESVSQAFKLIIETKNREDIETEDKIKSLEEKIPGEYNPSVFNYLMGVSDSDIVYMRDSLNAVITRAMQPGIRPEHLPEALEAMEAAIDSLGYSQGITGLLKVILANGQIRANMEYDAIATASEVERVIQSIEPVLVTIQPGEKLVSRGAYISGEQIEALQALNMLSQNSRILPYLGIFVFVCIIYTLLIAYIRLFHPITNGRESNIVFIGVLFNFILILCKLVSLINISGQAEIAAQIGYLLPVSAASMLLCVLLGRGLSIFITVLLGICTGILMGGQISFAIVAIIGGIVGIFHTTYLNQRSQFVGASLYIALANILVIGSWGFINGYSLIIIGVGMILGLINGAFASVLSIGLLPFIESVFKITTMVKLLELSNANHPLLKKLMMDAPGTYHHSILVGNLAEAAASEIGADTLVVRVASYYHDIGKIRRPYFFIENQMSGENPHDKLQPTLSTLIIISHVKEGIEMLREYKFPDEIIEIAEQHHGTGVLPYFYHKALEQEEDQSKIRKDDFRYPGPKPQTKEAAIVMLADSVQAAVQSMTNPAKGHVEQKIREIIKGKIDDGQLQECHLTFKDLEIIAQSFAKVLWGMHHNRIVYPDEVEEQIGSGANDYSHDNSKPARENKTGQSNHGPDAPSSENGASALPPEQEGGV